MRDVPFRIGSDHCPGFSKFIEETGEANQVIGKVQGLGHFGIHWDGQNLEVSLEKELGDVLASIDFLVERNHLNRHSIKRRRELKKARFDQWHENIQAGRDPNDGVTYGEDE